MVLIWQQKLVLKHLDSKISFISGFKTVVDMWFVILPVVMSIGTIATIIANYTPIFEIVGKPFVPF